MIEALEQALQEAESLLEREKGVIESLAARAQKSEQLALQAHEQADINEQASKFLAQFADERQAQVIESIQNIASLGLSQVFDEPIELTIEQVVRARRVEMDVRVKTGTLETSIMDARGGGLAAVAGFLLRAAVVLLTPNTRKLLVLDETFAMLSEDYVGRMSEFMQELCETTGLQIVLVSHQPEFADAADRVIRIEKINTNTSRLVTER